MKALKNEADEQSLVEAAKRDPAAFAELYQRNFYQVYAYISRRVAIREEAEDLTADVFQQALAKIVSFEWRGVPFAAWLTRIAANAIADRWQRQHKEQGTPLIQEPADPTMEGMEQRAILFQLVDGLPADQRRVVFLRFVEQKSIREIAEVLGRSEGAVKQLQFRALEKLRAQMEGANA